MKTSYRGIQLIKRFESCELEAYQDVVGVWTIGWGHTKTAKKGQVITNAEAEKLLKKDLEWAEYIVSSSVEVDLTQSMFDALVSFVFNVGSQNFQGSTLLRVLNSKAYLDVPAQLCRWKYAGARPLLGLLRRRLDEAKLFLEDGLCQ